MVDKRYNMVFKNNNNNKVIHNKKKLKEALRQLERDLINDISKTLNLRL